MRLTESAGTPTETRCTCGRPADHEGWSVECYDEADPVAETVVLADEVGPIVRQAINNLLAAGYSIVPPAEAAERSRVPGEPVPALPDQDALVRLYDAAMNGWTDPEADVYDLFIAELDALTIPADMPAAAVVGELTRAVKRAQMKAPAAARPALPDDTEALAALRRLVDLKDGPRDAGYRMSKEAAWVRARAVLAAVPLGPEPTTAEQIALRIEAMRPRQDDSDNPYPSEQFVLGAEFAQRIAARVARSFTTEGETHE